eukprot:12320414-Alexandrium_andersonii.AAC.1
MRAGPERAHHLDHRGWRGAGHHGHRTRRAQGEGPGGYQGQALGAGGQGQAMSLIHISEPTRLALI